MLKEKMEEKDWTSPAIIATFTWPRLGIGRRDTRNPPATLIFPLLRSSMAAIFTSRLSLLFSRGLTESARDPVSYRGGGGGEYSRLE
ncbi:hypothetical protein SAY86_004603 [Trapa natans]|uniref:Uncharacterized protein n=1 Tax=Trapa natans TaxID=22666 RepID=A0AAN7N4U4_TRANT|nr:hypothetical protein SAY86_004603 [Trapa natans]